MNEAVGPAKTPFDIVKDAAIIGNLEVVKFLINDIDAKCCLEVAKTAEDKGHMHVKDFVLETLAKQRASKNEASNAAQSEQMSAGPNTCPFLENWDEIRLIGKGAFGEVHEVVTDTGTRCAAKSIKLPMQRGETPDKLEEALQAEMNLCRLQHDNIVRFLHICKRQDATVVVFMELLDGCSLDIFISQNKPLDKETISEFCIQICSALEYMHSRQPAPVIHRDIKCSNIIVLADRIRIQLVDFGLSILMDPSLSHISEHSNPKGTLTFMAPELLILNEAARPHYSRESDIWAFGCSVYHMASGNIPFAKCLHQFSMLRLLEESGAPNLPDGCSAELQDFYGCCTAKDPKIRQSAEKLMGHKFLAAAVSEGLAKPPFREDWKNVCLLSRGGPAKDEVHEVLTDTGTKCATKTLKLPVQQGDQLDSGDTVGTNLLQSDRNLCRLRHENIVRFYHIVHQREAATVVVFMELLVGRTLEQFIDKKPQDEGTVRDFSKQICSALAYMHSLTEPIIHRDINCSNIFVLSGTTGNRVKLIDFGLAIKLEQLVTHANERSAAPEGNWYFMAPELLAPDESESSKYSRGSDIWAFGCSAYQMASGARPHDEKENVSQLVQVLRKSGAPALPDGCSAELQDFYGFCTAQDRSKRKSATELMKHDFLTAASSNSG